MADLVLENLTIAYGDVKAVNDISLHVKSGEFLTLLGPSGCGKSTTLFAIAGLNKATSGVIRVGDKDFFNGGQNIEIAPEDRNIGLVFQSYALWPHLSVFGNLAFPLKLRKIPKAEQKKRIYEALSLVEMDKFANRYPFELSGGQQQRVALARALVYTPGILLLDEPLSNLDAKLRERARVWLRELQERLKVTTIYVTHDQAEALAVSDRIAVLSNGQIQQLGTPKEIYNTPGNAFVADFIGSANFLEGTLKSSNSEWAIVSLNDGTELRCGVTKEPLDKKVTIAIRPELIRIASDENINCVKTTVKKSTYLGSVYQHELQSVNGNFRMQTSNELNDTNLNVHLPPEATLLFPNH